jgi:hypothetical protein
MAAPPRTDSYEFGRIVIDGRTYTSDVIVLPTGVKGDWWRAEGHRLGVDDLSDVLQQPPNVLVVGQGAYGRMGVPNETLACLEQAGIEVVCAPTARAIGIYSDRCQGGQAVAAAFLADHLGGRFEPIRSDFARSSVEVPVGVGHVPGVVDALREQ